MSDSLFPEIEAEVAALPDPPPPRPPLWLVIVWDGECWCMPPRLNDFYPSRERAVEAASTLNPTRWRHIRLVRIPGEGQQVIT